MYTFTHCCAVAADTGGAGLHWHDCAGGDGGGGREGDKVALNTWDTFDVVLPHGWLWKGYHGGGGGGRGIDPQASYLHSSKPELLLKTSLGN